MELVDQTLANISRISLSTINLKAKEVSVVLPFICSANIVSNNEEDNII